MEVRKESNGLKNSMVTREELAIINQFTKRALKEDEVYTFAVRLCDNEVDRDGERFPRATLEELAELFVGKSGIFDHEWTAKGQAARIYRTEIVEEEGVCSQGEGRCYLKGYTVKRGDTLWGIANTYGVTLTALLNVNPQIKNPNRIAVGERVTLP